MNFYHSPWSIVIVVKHQIKVYQNIEDGKTSIKYSMKKIKRKTFLHKFLSRFVEINASCRRLLYNHLPTGDKTVCSCIT